MSYDPGGSKWPLILLVAGAIGLAVWFAYKHQKGVGRGHVDDRTNQSYKTSGTRR